MDEKEAINRVKNSFRAKKSRAEIIRGFQKRGYKLEYADKIISKANRPKKIMVFALLSLVILFLAFLTSYSFMTGSYKIDIKNPLAGLSLITGNVMAEPQSPQNFSSGGNPVNVKEIEITPEFISYLLNEAGAWQLHKNPLTFEKPIINFQIGEETFHSEVGKEIESKRGLSDNADIQFNGNKEELIMALTSQNPQDVFKKSIESGKTEVHVFAGKPELFAKGYLNLYDSLR